MNVNELFMSMPNVVLLFQETYDVEEIVLVNSFTSPLAPVNAL